MSDTNRVDLNYWKESVWGVLAPTTFTALRFISESLSHGITNVSSTEIRSDRQIVDLIQVDQEPTGGFNFELSKDTGFEDFLEGALWESWSTPLAFSITTPGSIQAGPSEFYAAASLDFSSAITGMWIQMSGWNAGSANDGFYFVTSHTDPTAAPCTIGVIPTPTTDDGTNNAGTVDILGAYIRNGVTEKSYTLERVHADVTQYFDFIGMVVNNFTLSAAAGAIVTGTFDLIGKETTLAATPATAGATTAAGARDVMSASTNVGEIYEGATLATISASLFIQSIDLSLANNVRGLKAISHLGNADIGVGSCNVTGTLNTYFKDNTLYDKYLAGTPTGLSFKVEDTIGNAYIFTMPNIEFSTDAINAGSQDSDVMENLGFQAIRHGTYDYTFQVCKFSTHD